MTEATGWHLWAALLAAALAAACTSEPVGPPPEPPRPAHALADLTSDELTVVAAPPGQEVVVLAPALKNVSSKPLTITKLRVTGADGVPDVAEIVRVALVKPGSGGPGTGTYVTFPPVVRRGGECRPAQVTPARGTTLAPGDRPLLLLWLRAIAPGSASIPTLTASYEHDGSGYIQEVALTRPVAVGVDSASDPMAPSAAERACAPEVRLLPGAVQI